MKRWLVAMATFALVAGACTAGGGEETPSAIDTGTAASHEPVTIEMWTAWTSKAEIEDFNADHRPRSRRRTRGSPSTR